MGEQRFVRTSIFLISIELTTKLFGLGFFVLVARFLGAKEIGLYAFAVSLANFFVIIPRFGFARLVQKEVGRDATLFYYYFREIGAVKALLSLGALGLLWSYLLATSETNQILMILVGFFVFIYSFLEFITALFRGIQRPELEGFARVLFSVANLSLGAAALYAGWGLMGVVTTQIVSAVAAVILAVLIIRRVAVKVRDGWQWRVLWGHMVAAAPFAGILIALYFSNQVGIVVLSWIAGREEVGYFAAAYKLFDNLTLIPAAVMGAFLPTMSRLYGVGEGRFVRTLRFTLIYLFVLSAPIVVGTVIFARPITVLLYRESFVPSAPALQIIVTALIFSFWNYACDSVLIARNRQRLLAGLTWLEAVIHVGANCLLIPAFSYLGASWAILTTQALHFLLVFAFLRRYLSLCILLKLIALPALSAGIMGAVAILMRNHNMGMVIVISMVVYVLSLFALGAVRRSDMESLEGMMDAHPEPRAWVS